MQDLGHDQEHIHEHQHDQEDLTPHMTAKLSFQEVVILVLRMKQVRQQHLVPVATLPDQNPQAPHQKHLVRSVSA